MCVCLGYLRRQGWVVVLHNGWPIWGGENVLSWAPQLCPHKAEGTARPAEGPQTLGAL